MNRISDEDLLGYTLAALDSDDQEQMDLLIHQQCRAANRVAQIQHDLRPLDGLAPPATPPTGLARRTCECIAAVPWHPPASPELTRRGNERRRGFSEKREWPGGRGSISVRDIAVGAAVLLLLGSILLPAVNHSRFQSRLVGCQDNLRTVGLSLLDYANQHGGTHLAIPLDKKLGIAGIVAPTLKQAGYIEDDSLFFCAGQRHGDDFVPRIPECRQIATASGRSLIRLQRMAGGDYAYSMGQTLAGGQYAATRNESRPWYVLLADQPGPDGIGRGSGNHNGVGQNVFFEDGHTQFLSTAAVDGDSIYENDWGCVAPGCPR